MRHEQIERRKKKKNGNAKNARSGDRKLNEETHTYSEIERTKGKEGKCEEKKKKNDCQRSICSRKIAKNMKIRKRRARKKYVMLKREGRRENKRT